jgi:hypothetical protein
MKAATLLLIPCLWSCTFDASGFMCQRPEAIVPTAFEPVDPGCPQWPGSIDLHECEWYGVVDQDRCSEYRMAACPGWEAQERISWDGQGTIFSFRASARTTGGEWCAYKVTFERGDE